MTEESPSSCVIRALRSSLEMRDRESEALRAELEESRLWADRGWARVKLLEERLAAIVEIAQGK